MVMKSNNELSTVFLSRRLVWVLMPDVHDNNADTTVTHIRHK